MPTQKAKNARAAQQEPRPGAPPEADISTTKTVVKKIVLGVLKLRRRLHRKLKKVVAKPAKPPPAAPPAAIPPLPPPAREEDKLALVAMKQVEEVTEAARQRTTELLNRGEKLEALSLKSEELMQASQDFEKCRVKLMKSKWWDRLKMGAAVAAGVIAAAAVAAVCVARRAVRTPPPGRPSPPIRRSRYSRYAY
ncbi:hypothetical protein HXX76_012929 [Chlamydomonas incerta]|uniref:V-SNARE coiled-coil homology domain-containing protein n=1 Tax=Chlamydomonas incerta TaxID=51695 RepID=A0A835VV39_CHLIN|nr:hypothetical protein HXX76_012929 [Chlamydomonas incerta]|eukprot:KAG2426614.1 hypothetical protein HXX76_012929 [Chlamydomonas incerta]